MDALAEMSEAQMQTRLTHPPVRAHILLPSNKSLRDFIGESMEKEDKKYNKKRPDFVCVDHDNKTIILEIKRPSVELKKEEIDQAVLYLRMIKNIDLKRSL